MTLQLEIEGIAPPSIPSRTGHIKLSSLRPGDWIHRDPFGVSTRLCVTINSAKHSRVVVRYRDGHEESVPYNTFIGYGETYIGRGSARRWHKFLPRFLRKQICPYSKP